MNEVPVSWIDSLRTSLFGFRGGARHSSLDRLNTQDTLSFPGCCIYQPGREWGLYEG